MAGRSKVKLYDELGLEILEESTRNCVGFLWFSDTNVQSTYSTLFQLLWVHTTQEILKTFLYSI